MRISLVQVLAACLSVNFFALCSVGAAIESSSNNHHRHHRHRHRHRHRQRPMVYDGLDIPARQLSSNSFYQNTYNPWSKQKQKPTEYESLSNSIPWGDINIVVVTDVHSWIAGNHKDDPRHWPYDANRPSNQDADYGHVLSFYQRLQQLVHHHNNQNKNPANTPRDLFFVMNGDFVDGTGLSGYPPTHLGPLLQHMPWDAINIGNHELYHDETIQYIINEQQHHHHHHHNETSTTVRRWNPKGYLSSNTILQNNDSSSQSMTGNKFTYLRGKHTNKTILAFGFLYDFDEGGSLTSHANVRDTIPQKWFQQVLKQDNFDAILVLAHMDCLHPLIEVLLKGIRSALPPHKHETMPIQFVTGHTHRRCHAKLDPQAESFEAGRFLDTIGVVSLDSSYSEKNSTVFRHRFLDANLEAMHNVLVHEHQKQDPTMRFATDFDEDFGTSDGRALTQAIRNTQSSLGLDELLGCAPQTYGLFEEPAVGIAAAKNYESTLWDLYLHQMLPTQLLQPIHQNDRDRGEPIFVSGTGILRYSIFEGPVTINDIIAISPFNDTIHELVAFEKKSIRLPIYGNQLVELLDFANEFYASVAEYGLSTFVLATLSCNVAFQDAANTIDPNQIYRILATDYDAYRLLTAIAKAQESGKMLFADGRSYQSRLVSPTANEPGEYDCYYLTELWNDFIRKTMPCDIQDQLSLRSGASNSLLSAAQMLQPPSSRMTPAQEDAVLASDQKAAALLVVVAVAMIVYLMTYPPEQQRIGNKNTPVMAETKSHDKSHDSNLQLIPLRRYNTGNLSEGSYGSI